MRNKIDIFDLLPQEAHQKLDEVGYNFLKENGYDTEGASESEEKRGEIKKELKKRGEELRYSGAVDPETKAILVWYELYRKGERVAVSKGIKFLPKPMEGEGNGRENQHNQEEPSPPAEDHA